MKRVFFRYFLSVFSIAVLVLLVQFGMLVFQYRVSQDKWKSRVYEDFAVSAKEAMSQGFYDGYGINSLLLAFSSIDEDRVSGFLLRDVDDVFEAYSLQGLRHKAYAAAVEGSVDNLKV